MSQVKTASSSHSSHVRQHHLPTRSARPSCDERLACRGPSPNAYFSCADCGTNQCEACCLLIHERPRYREHEQLAALPPPDPQLLCQGASCAGENLADVRCHTCERSYCLACSHLVHLAVGRKAPHIKVRFSYYWDRLKKDEEGEDDEEEYLSVDTGDSFHEAKNNMMSLASMEPDLVSDIRSVEGHAPLKESTTSSFLLVNDKEVLQVASASEFASRLGTSGAVKVLSILGNTGEGKSHTLNETFYDGGAVFQTSNQQSSCTVGVWAAYCPGLNLVTLDTEGLLGMADNQNQRTRLLLKILAISDIVVYRTRAERLHSDLFNFLGDASRAYVEHFCQELKDLKERCSLAGPVSSLGPAVIVFHETMHTTPFSTDRASSELMKGFEVVNQRVDAFSALNYVGIQTKELPTRFDGLRAAVEREISNSTVRCARPAEVIFQALKVLNEKFSGEISKTIPSTFPDQYFTCPVVCISCSARCNKTMNHRDSHGCSRKCQYQHQFQNKVFQCKSCYTKQGLEVVLTPQTAAKGDTAWLGWAKCAWSGYVLECPSCGVIYQSRQYWYGNKNPEETVVREEITHVWPGHKNGPLEVNNTAQRLLDGIQVITETVSTYSAKPTQSLSDWFADQINPTYWSPNTKMQKCHKCERGFSPQEKKHHCRACGNGFCELCSSKKRTVPERGWGNELVRVCDDCFEAETCHAETSASSEPGTESELTARKVGEVICSTLGVVASAMEYPIGFIKDSARPSYWTPDHELTACAVCAKEFGTRRPIHHCRSCGMGVCNECSTHRRPVISRGWESPVRVCSTCNERSDL